MEEIEDSSAVLVVQVKHLKMRSTSHVNRENP